MRESLISGHDDTNLTFHILCIRNDIFNYLDVCATSID